MNEPTPQRVVSSLPPLPIKARAFKTIERMRANPRDWRIGDVEALANQVGLTCKKPTNGSHYTVSSPHLNGVLTIPAKRPIKPVYINDFVDLIDAHIKQMAIRSVTK
jgi:hypothetical protein